MRNSRDGDFPPISMSMPLARQVDSMILKQSWMVGSWLDSSSKRLYDSSLWAFKDRAGDSMDEVAKEANDPAFDFNLL